jgi:hypothetical protein
MSASSIAVRVGVIACVAFACVIGAGRLDDALAVFDFEADANARAVFNERVYPEIDGLESWARVIEDARLWMPEDASYRVVDRSSVPTGTTTGSLRIYLDVLLMPRRRTELESEPWVFCYGCTRATLGPAFEVLSDSGHGLVFARRRS